ncbi:MAG: hypothetical protein GYB68_01535 [Chloroflexi bacterium]|nr:hypothetical protein [Chloroflexota bacterium]
MSSGQTPSLSSPTNTSEVEGTRSPLSTQSPFPTIQSETLFLELIARLPGGEAANQPSYLARMSDDGKQFVFLSTASNLLLEQSGQDPRLTIFFRSTTTNDTYPLSEDRFTSISNPTLSADGRTAAFLGYQPGTCADQQPQRSCGAIYIYNLPSASYPEELLVGSIYPEGPDIALSHNGQFLAFAEPWGEILEGVFLYDRQTGDVTEIIRSDTTDGAASELGPVGISANGDVVAFAAARNDIVPDDTNNANDVFVYSSEDETIERISLRADGSEPNQPSGRHVWGGGIPGEISISDNGRFVTYLSRASGLTEIPISECTTYSGEVLPACAHIYVYDRQSKQTEMISVSNTGVPGNRESVEAFISGDGRWVAFTSLADNLTDDSPECQGFCPRVFLRDRQERRTYLASRGIECEPVTANVSDLNLDGSVLVLESPDLLLETSQNEGVASYIVNIPEMFAQCFAGFEQ